MLVTTTQSLCLLFKQQREKSSMPEDRTWCSRGNLGRFEEHSVTRCCVWGESCGGNPQLEQNKTEDARNKIFWGWIVISCCKMCLLLYKNEGLVEIFFVFLPFFKSGVFHFITTHFAIKVNICVQENHIHIYFSTLWVKSFVFNILLLGTTPWTHNIRLFIFAFLLSFPFLLFDLMVRRETKAPSHLCERRQHRHWQSCHHFLSGILIIHENYLFLATHTTVIQIQMRTAIWQEYTYSQALFSFSPL